MIFKRVLLSLLSAVVIGNVCADDTENGYDRHGYVLRPEMGIGSSNYHSEGAPYANVDFGYQFSNPFFAGVGVEYTIASPNYHRVYSTLPIYISTRVSPVKRPVTPFVDLKIGYNIALKSRDYYYHSYYRSANSLWNFEENIEEEKWEGLFLFTSIGIQIRKVEFLCFFNITGALFEKKIYNSETDMTIKTEEERRRYGGLGIKLGYNINLSR